MRCRFISFIVLFLLTQSAFTNAVVYNNGAITELFFDANGNWTVEFRLNHLHHYEDSAFYLYSLSDSARLIVTPDSVDIYVITQSNFVNTLYIDPNGDILTIKSFGEAYGYVQVTDDFIFGDIPESGVLAPFVNQSLVTIEGLNGDYIVKDNVHSPGYEKDPAKGTFKGYIYDSLFNPLPYQKLQSFDAIPRILWTDENGYFEDTTIYGRFTKAWILKNNTEHILDTNLYIEPDEVSQVDYIIPIGPQVTATGICFLTNGTDHSGTYVIFTPECPGSVSDTAITDSSGNFSISIPPGKYNYRFSHYGYLPYSTYLPEYFYEDRDLATVLEEGIVNEIPTGKVQGYWVPNAEYWIMGNIFIEAGDTLQLDPGVKIVFKGIWRFDVHGTLLAEGTENDSIYLISGMDGWVKWKSLNFFDTSSISKISYAHIEKVFDGINYYSNSSHLIKSLLFSARGIQVNGVASPWIGENRFLGCAIPAVESRDESTPTIYKNSFEYTGIRVWGNSIPNVHYNTFYSTFITILCVGTEQPEIIGNIFYNCMYAINPPASGEINTIAYNLLYETSPSWGSIDIPGYGIVTSVNFNGDSCDIYFNLIEKDPLFEDPDNRNFHLLPESPCIDAGDPDSPHDPDNTIADMGAYFYDQLGIYVKEPSAFENKYEIIAIPNPNSGSFTISVDSPKEHHYEASLLLYSLNGILMDTRNIAYLERGDNNIRFSSIGHNQNITDGIYICILSIRGKTLANTKIIIINE